jgi:tetratricopeptide (TPR) repeat protein
MTSGNGNGGGAGADLRDPEIDRARLRAVHAALTAGDIPTAGKLAEDALGDGIDHPMVLNLVAGRREEEGRLDEALDLLRRAQAGAPEAIGIMNAIGLCLTRMGRFDEAVREYGAALARDPRFAPALANRATALMGLAEFDGARRDYEEAAAIDPRNLIAADGLAALALRRGEPGEARRLAARVLAREPDFPSAVMTTAGADIAEGHAGAAESALKALVADSRLNPVDRAIAWGLRGDALDALGSFAEAFEAWSESNALQKLNHRADFAGRQGTLGLVEQLTAALEGKRVPAAWGHGGRSPARRHVFLVGFPRSGTAPIEQLLDAHPDIVALAGKECLIDATRAWMADAAKFEQFCAAEDEALESYRDAYWRRVADEGVDPGGRVFVDKHPFNTFKLPLIARLFPDARVLFARRDPRDAVLACFRHRFRMSDPVYQMLTLEGAAALYAATMRMVEATEQAFGLYLHAVQLEAVLAGFDGEAKAVCDFIGVPFAPGPPEPRGLDADGLGKWHDYAAQMAPVLPALQPWVDRFGAS